MIREVISHRRAKVLNGVATLDDFFGSREWVKAIDPETLDISRGDRCVLGQAFGPSPFGDVGYFFGVQVLGLNDGEAIERGFDVAPDEKGRIDLEHYRDLNDEWRQWLAEQEVPVS